MRGRSLLAGVTLAIAGILVLAASGHSDSVDAGRQVQQTVQGQTTTVSSLAAPVSPSPQTSESASLPGTPTLVSPTPESASRSGDTTQSPSVATTQPVQRSTRAKVNPLQAVPAPADTSSLRVYIKTKQGTVLPSPSPTSCAAPVQIGVMDVPSYAMVTPPEPAGHNWCDTSVRIKASAYPSSPSTGTTYVYGHACAHHVCPFTDIRLLPGGGYSVQPGDQVVAETSTGVLTLRVCRVYSSPKDGPFKEPNCGGQSIDLVIIACEYEPGTTYDNGMNVVVAATLVASKKL